MTQHNLASHSWATIKLRQPSLSCVHDFRPYNGPVRTTASNIPDSRFIWNSTKIIFQESTLYKDNFLDVKDILMSSDSKMDTRFKTVLKDCIGTDSSSNYWCRYNFLKHFMGT